MTRVVCTVALLLGLCVVSAQAGITCSTWLEGNTVYLQTKNTDQPWGVGKPGILDNGRIVPESRDVEVVVSYSVDYAAPSEVYVRVGSYTETYNYSIRAGSSEEAGVYTCGAVNSTEVYRGRWRITVSVSWYEEGYDARSLDERTYYYRSGY